MRALGSLQNRIFLASAVLAALSIGGAVYFVSARITSAIEAELQRDLGEAASLVDQQRASLFDTFALMARLVADLPKFKAAVGTRDGPTVQPIAVEYQQQVGSDVFIVSDAAGRVLASIGGSPDLVDRLAWTGTRAGPSPDLVTAVWPHPRGLLQVMSVPITIGLNSPELLGTLTVGYLLDDERAAQFKALTGADVAFALGSDVRASTLGPDAHGALAPLVTGRAISRVVIGDSDYEALARPLSSASISAPAIGGSAMPTALVLKSRTERMATLSTIQTALVGLAFATMLLAVAISYAVARTITRPLAAITDHMRHVAATGDLTRKIALRDRHGWDDDDARVLATTFNTLTDSIATFQREATERERLSSLGRMSSIIAHEVRNPLMIIKGALRQITRDHATPADIADAAADIDEEILRLNRLVDEVLDIARPIRFERAPTDLNAVCRAAAAAASAGEPDPIVAVDLDPQVPTLDTDGERLRTALVNLLANARQAVQARNGHEGIDAPAASRYGVTLLTRRLGERRVAIIVRDGGIGIAPDDLARVFDPYFTTRRAGTGLGLPIAKNIVEGLGGAIGVSSQPGSGTDVRIELGDAPPPRI